MQFGIQNAIQNELKIRGIETAKFDSRLDGSSIFDVPGVEETMKNRCQNHVNIELQLDSNLGPILEGLGSQVGAQVEAKRHPKQLENSIGILMNFEAFSERAQS